MTAPEHAPDRDRPAMPAGYGLLSWSDVEPRLVASLHYWLATVRPDGTPHSVPRWGVWVAGRFYYDGSPLTRHARNAERNPACTVTLESGSEVVIVEGTSTATGPIRPTSGRGSPPRSRNTTRSATRPARTRGPARTAAG